MRAFVIEESSGALECSVRAVDVAASAASDVLIRVDYSGVNFKDALVAMAPSRVRRIATLVGGVDAAGTVHASSDPQFPEGARVAVHGGDLGVGRDGGFAEFVYVPARMISLLPPAVDVRTAMIIGTAGFTAMASLLALEEHGLAAGAEVLVTGATGGVGSIAVTLLAARGFHPVASTGSSHQASWLTERGAVRVIGRSDISDRLDRVLGSERGAGAVDCVGGETLHHVLRSLRYGASVAASGLVASAELSTTVYPFITRAVNLLGIDAVEAPVTLRDRVWRALGDIAPSVDFAPLVDREIGLADLPAAFESVRGGTTRGRILVALNQG